MIYNIDINQKAIIDNNLDLDIVEAFIVFGIFKLKDLSWVTKITIEDKVFYWFKHTFLKEQLPMLKITPDRLYRILKELERKGFVEAHPQNRLLKQSFYAIGENANILLSCTKKSELNYIGENTEQTAKTPSKPQRHRTNIGENTERNRDFTSVETPMKYNKDNKENNKEKQDIADLKKSDVPALKHLDSFIQAIEHLNLATGRKFEISEQDKKGKTDKYKMVCKLFAAGYSIEDVKLVVDAKTKEWLLDTKMAKHLTYSTLFAARNFEKYLQEIKAGDVKAVENIAKNDLNSSTRSQIELLGYKCQKGTIERLHAELKTKMQIGATDAEIGQKVLAFLGTAESKKYTDLNAVLFNFSTILETIKKQKQNGTNK